MTENNIAFDYNLNKHIKGVSPIDIDIIVLNEGRYAFLRLGDWCFRLLAFYNQFGKGTKQLEIFDLADRRTTYIGFDCNPSIMFEWIDVISHPKMDKLSLDFAYIRDESQTPNSRTKFGFVLTTLSTKRSIVTGNLDDSILSCEAFTLDNHNGKLIVWRGGHSHEINGVRYNDIGRIIIFGSKN